MMQFQCKNHNVLPFLKAICKCFNHGLICEASDFVVILTTETSQIWFSQNNDFYRAVLKNIPYY